MSKGKSFIPSQLLGIGGMLIGQLCSFPLSAQAQTYTETPSGNCGFSRPFVKGDLRWSGWSAVTTGYSQGALNKLYGEDYQHVAYQKTPQTGASATAIADAGLSGARGTFRGRVDFKTSFYTTVHTYIYGPFSC